MKHAATLVKEFHERQPTAPQPLKVQVLQEQQKHKEGMLLQTVTIKGELPIFPRSQGSSTKRGYPIRFYTPCLHAQPPSGYTGINQLEEWKPSNVTRYG